MPRMNRAQACRAWVRVAFLFGCWGFGCWAILGLLGCVDASVDPAKISARVISAGEYSFRRELPVFSESRTKIPCKLGQLFGVEYELIVADGDSGLLPVEFKWHHPEMPIEGTPRIGTETTGGASNPTLKRGASVLLGRSLWSIDSEKERVSGIYGFEVRTIKNRRTLLSQDFEVDGC